MWQAIDRRLEGLIQRFNLRELIIALIGASILDFIGTYACLNNLAGWETLPYQRFLLKHLGWIGFIAVRLVILAIIILCGLRTKGRRLASLAAMVYVTFAFIYCCFIGLSLAYVQYKIEHP